MATYPANAPPLSFGISLSKEFRILSAAFGDGYTQRTGDGLNTQIETWKMVWETILESEKQILTDFFDSLEGFQSFDFTAPGDSTEKKWTVKGYEDTPFSSTYFRLEAEFERVYDL